MNGLNEADDGCWVAKAHFFCEEGEQSLIGFGGVNEMTQNNIIKIERRQDLAKNF